ncbi:MAG: type IV secretory system conjugative DNA transfer family protein [Candidatus Micrarchaeaceae archaeon]
MEYRLSNSGSASKAFCMFDPSERFVWSSEAVYIGRSSIYAVPIFIGVNSILNQHVCVIGMSGSGKTFLLKNLAGKQASNGRCVVVIDWNSEYSSVVAYFYGTELKIRNGNDTSGIAKGIASLYARSGIVSINLSPLNGEEEKRSAAKSVLKAMLENLGDVPSWNGLKKTLVLDEAWKVLRGDELSMLFREGRKYGIGIVIASQTASDLSSDIIANCATIAIFRLQSANDFSLLLDARIISESDIGMLAKMRRGSCMVAMAATKDRPRRVVYVPEIEGSGYSICFIRDGKMEINVPIEVITSKLALISSEASVRQGVESYINQGGGKIELEGLVGKLIELGIARSSIVVYLRALGVPDTAIIHAYRRQVQAK